MLVRKAGRMYKIISRVSVFFAALFFVTNLCFAGSAQEAFLRANDLYEQKRFQSALDLYQTISNKGGAAWHNIGSCWYHLGNYAQAIACWRLAQKNSSSVSYAADNPNALFNMLDPEVNDIETAFKKAELEKSQGKSRGDIKIALYNTGFFNLCRHLSW